MQQVLQSHQSAVVAVLGKEEMEERALHERALEVAQAEVLAQVQGRWQSFF